MTDEFDNRTDLTEEEKDEKEEYEKYCFLCHRPESQTGKMIDLPNNIHICPDCMQEL